jgi:drug/metabolite transporter (DMT)-like permease
LKSPAARYGLLFLGIAGLSLAGVFYRLATAPAVAMVAWRMLIGTVILAPVALGMHAANANRARFGGSDIRASMAAGAFFCVDLVLWAVSLRYTSVASAALFVSTQPIYVAAIAAAYFGERPTRAVVAGIALGIVGIVVVGAVDLRVSGQALIGDALALAAALAETAYLLIGRRVRQRIDAPRYVLVVYATCAACCWVVLVFSGISARLSGHDMLLAFGVALSATVIGHTLVSLSLGYMPAAVVAVSFLAQPMLAALFALAFLHQTIPWTTVAGGLIALVGIGIVAYANERQTPGRASATAT